LLHIILSNMSSLRNDIMYIVILLFQLIPLAVGSNINSISLSRHPQEPKTVPANKNMMNSHLIKTNNQQT
jgi:hypothetical protein